MSIRWSTLIANPTNGSIDYARVRSLVSVLLATVGGAATIWVIFLARNVNETLVSIAVAACVLPLTGGKIADVISGRSVSASIQAGTTAGRRNSDQAQRVTPVGPTEIDH